MEPTQHRSLSHLASLVITSFERKEEPNHEKKITVNPVVSKFASLYEKVRNAMEYREEEVVLRATIERILRRRLLLGGNAQTTAEPLVRELLWARYLQENSVPESIVYKVEHTIDLYLKLRFAVLRRHRLSESVLNEWTYQLMSSDIEHILNPKHEKETISNFMFQVLRHRMTIEEVSEETKNAQVYIAVRRAFDRDDVAFLRYHLFQQYFGRLTRENLEHIAEHFLQGYREIMQELNFPGRERIYTYVKRRTAAFFILEDVLEAHKGKLRELVHNQDELAQAIYKACENRYQSIASKVQRAIIRSVLFILFSKVLFAFAIEGTYERIFEGGIRWGAMAINIVVPPFLMIIVSVFMRPPSVDNSNRIFAFIQQLLYEDNPKLGNDFTMKKKEEKNPLSDVFNILWLFAFMLSFGTIIFVLTKLHFNIVSQFVFIFFLAIVSFLAYRIALTANLYTVGERQGLVTPIVDFLFMPVVRVGRHLTQSISRINFLLFIFDFFIETPFKILFAFFEQWFLFLHRKAEEMG